VAGAGQRHRAAPAALAGSDGDDAEPAGGGNTSTPFCPQPATIEADAPTASAAIALPRILRAVIGSAWRLCIFDIDGF